jgi:hypothetical protein
MSHKQKQSAFFYETPCKLGMFPWKKKYNFLYNDGRKKLLFFMVTITIFYGCYFDICKLGMFLYAYGKKKYIIIFYGCSFDKRCKLGMFLYIDGKKITFFLWFDMMQTWNIFMV